MTDKELNKKALQIYPKKPSASDILPDYNEENRKAYIKGWKDGLENLDDTVKEMLNNDNSSKLPEKYQSLNWLIKDDLNKEFLYVLDYTGITLNVIYLHNGDINPNDFETAEELLDYWGFNPDQCSWMFSNVELDINHIVVPLKN